MSSRTLSNNNLVYILFLSLSLTSNPPSKWYVIPQFLWFSTWKSQEESGQNVCMKSSNFNLCEGQGHVWCFALCPQCLALGLAQSLCSACFWTNLGVDDSTAPANRKMRRMYVAANWLSVFLMRLQWSVFRSVSHSTLSPSKVGQCILFCFFLNLYIPYQHSIGPKGKECPVMFIELQRHKVENPIIEITCEIYVYLIFSRKE